MDFYVKPPAQKSPGDHFKGSTEMLGLSPTAFETRAETESGALMMWVSIQLKLKLPMVHD